MRGSGKYNQGLLEKFQAGAEGSIEKNFRRSIEHFFVRNGSGFLRTDLPVRDPEKFVIAGTNPGFFLPKKTIVALKSSPAGYEHW